MLVAIGFLAITAQSKRLGVSIISAPQDTPTWLYRFTLSPLLSLKVVISRVLSLFGMHNEYKHPVCRSLALGVSRLPFGC